MPFRLTSEDWSLSRKTSAQSSDPARNQGLRTVRVDRLRDSLKAIARLSLRQETWSIFCEPCGKWTRRLADDPPMEWTCPHCSRVYGMEYVLYSELEQEIEETE